MFREMLTAYRAPIRPSFGAESVPASPASAGAHLSALPTRQERFAAAIASVVESHRAVAAAEARHAAHVEAARLAGIALHSTDSFTGGPQWSSEMVVERQIITELAVALNLSEGDARRLLETSEGLAETFADTRTALEAGRISFRHAEKIVHHAQTLPPECVADYEATLLPLARTVTVQKLDRLARGAVEEAQPKTAIQRHIDAAANRRLYLDPASDGMAYLTHYLPAVEAVAIYNRATDLARSAKNAGDERTLTQLRVDTLSDLLVNGETSVPTASRGIRARVTVTVPVLTLLGHPDRRTPNLTAAGHGTATPTPTATAAAGHGTATPTPTAAAAVHGTATPTPTAAAAGHGTATPTPTAAAAAGHSSGTATAAGHPSGTATVAEAADHLLRRAAYEGGSAWLDGYGPIDRRTALELTRDAPSFGRVLTDPISGRTLSYGRERYKPPAELDDLIRQTHRECTFPLCGESSATADLDHTIAWSDGGETSFANLSPLCSSHHKVKHHTDWLIEQSPGGTITWTSPAGFAYVVEPTRIAKPLPTFTETAAGTRAHNSTREPAREPAPF